MIKKTDRLEFKVFYKENDVMKFIHCSTFAGAAGCAEALSGVVRYINLTASNEDRSSSWTVTLHKYGTDNTREIVSQFAVNQLMEVSK